jgi:hypothetical protein
LIPCRYHGIDEEVEVDDAITALISAVNALADAAEETSNTHYLAVPAHMLERAVDAATAVKEEGDVTHGD